MAGKILSHLHQFNLTVTLRTFPPLARAIQKAIKTHKNEI